MLRQTDGVYLRKILLLCSKLNLFDCLTRLIVLRALNRIQCSSDLLDVPGGAVAGFADLALLRSVIVIDIDVQEREEGAENSQLFEEKGLEGDFVGSFISCGDCGDGKGEDRETRYDSDCS